MVKYVEATESDYPKLNDFYNRIYKANRTLEQFKWEFHDGPFGPSIYVFAEDNGKVVGTNCAIPFELVNSEGNIIRSAKSEDTLVDPAYRGQNIFYNIYQFLFEACKAQGIEVIWGFTSADRPFKKVGFETPYKHKQTLAVNDVLPSYRYLSSLNTKNTPIDRFKIFGLCVLSKMKLNFSRVKLPGGYHFKISSGNLTGSDQLLQSNLNAIDSSYCIKQTADFQRWRIDENPHYTNTLQVDYFDKQEQLVGRMILNINNATIGFVCESIFHGGLAANEAGSIIRHFSSIAFANGASMIRNWVFETNPMNNREIEAYLIGGHTSLDRGIWLVWKNLSDRKIDPSLFLLSRMSSQGTS